jgi:drug/metabolite transporter (DMT)-like permease
MLRQTAHPNPLLKISVYAFCGVLLSSLLPFFVFLSHRFIPGGRIVSSLILALVFIAAGIIMVHTHP